MGTKKRINFLFYSLNGLLVILGVLSLPGVEDRAESLLEGVFSLKALFQWLGAHSALILNIYAVSLLAFMLNLSIGFGPGMLADVRDSWRRLPSLIRTLLLTIGVIALILNIAALIWLLLVNLEKVDGVTLPMEEKIPEYLRQWLGTLPASSLNFLFSLALSCALVVGHLNAPSWKRIRVPQRVIEEDQPGTTTLRLTKKDRQRLRKAERYIEKGKLYKAARLFEDLGDEFYYRAGKFYGQKGHVQQASRAFLKAGDYYLARRNLPRAADAYYYGCHWVKASQAYERFMTQENLQGDKERMLQCAERWAESVFRQNRFKEAAHLYLRFGLYRKAGEAFEKAGMATDAAEAYGKAGAFESSYKALTNSGLKELAEMEKGKHLLLRGEFLRAAEVFEAGNHHREAIDAYQKAKLPGMAARVCRAQGDLEKAAELFLEAGEDERALLCYRDMGEFTKAAQLAAHMGLRDKQAEYFQKSGLMIPAARSYLMIGEMDKAVACLGKVEIENDETAEDCARILTNLYEQNRLREALACAKAMLEGKKPKKVLAPLLFCLARVYERLGNAKEMAHYYFKTANLLPDNHHYMEQAKRASLISGIAFKPKAEDTTPTKIRETPTPPASKAEKAPQKHARPKLADEQDNTLTLDEQTVFDITQDGALQRYQVISQLGKGGMGFVYKARDKKLKRFVALKMLYPENNREPRIMLFFKREAMAIASLNHPNIVHLFDAGMERGCFYMIMEFVEGSTLQQLLKKYPRFLSRNLIAIWHQTCLGLKYAHENGILHRDLKPSNIMLDRDRRVKILDFGLAKEVNDISRTRQVWGTPSFMAPELLQGERANFQTDIYSLGATFYMLATKQSPFKKQDIAEKLVRKDRPEPPSKLNPNISSQLSDIILKCLRFKPEDRYASIEDLLDGIKRLGKRLG